MKKKKIAVIGLKGLPAFGGAATVGENIIEQLKDKYDFTVYSSSSHTSLKTGNYNRYKQIVFRKIFPGKLNSLYYYIASMIHCMFYKFDLVHTHHNISGMIVPILKIRYKVLFTFHETGKTRENFKNIGIFVKIFTKLGFKISNIATVVSYVYFLENKSKANLYFIPNGITIEKCYDRYNKINEEYIMFAAGRILPSKGLHILLRALQLSPIHKKLKIAGNYSYYAPYWKELSAMSNDKQIEYLGLIKNKDVLFEYIINAKYFIFPSSIEAMSMMLLEVAALKVPIICSDIPENTSVFNSEEVLYFKTDDSADLAQKIIWAENNYQVMKYKSELAFKKVKENYSWENLAMQYNELIKELLTV